MKKIIILLLVTLLISCEKNYSPMEQTARAFYYDKTINNDAGNYYVGPNEKAGICVDYSIYLIDLLGRDSAYLVITGLQNDCKAGYWQIIDQWKFGEHYYDEWFDSLSDDGGQTIIINSDDDGEWKRTGEFDYCKNTTMLIKDSYENVYKCRPINDKFIVSEESHALVLFNGELLDPTALDSENELIKKEIKL